jgi:lipopolysaccharide/colanic/teichoic acid biosynthesis glycosyltransferase
MDDTRMPSHQRDGSSSRGPAGHRPAGAPANGTRNGEPHNRTEIRCSRNHLPPDPGSADRRRLRGRGTAPAVLAPCGCPIVGQVRGRAYVRVVKPAMDRTLAVILIFLTLPLLLVIALIVRLKLGREILFRQERVGLDGRPFTMYKFRTMRPDRRVADLPFGGVDRRVRHKSDTDPRHTHCGRVLRATSLDELPQLWNVVRGDMSLVGPRPELVSVVETYEPWQHQRHVVKPGLTGLWQVGHREGEGLMRDDTDIDLDYIRQLSIVVDLRILLTTIPAVLSRSGS